MANELRMSTLMRKEITKSLARKHIEKIDNRIQVLLTLNY